MSAAPRGLAGWAMAGAYLTVGAAVAIAASLASVLVGGARGARWRERCGLWRGHRQQSGAWIWIHGASVGEADIALAVAAALAPHTPEIRLVVTTTTPTGQARVQHAGSVESRYFPIDFPLFIRRILGTNPPLLFVAVETEIWPGLLRAMARHGVPVAVVNARLSERSIPRYRRLAPLFAPLLEGVARVCARDKDAAGKWRALGVREAAIVVTGNIKFDLAVPNKAQAIVPLFVPVPRSPLLLAASTHEGEEALVLEAWAVLRSRVSRDIRLLLAPRHPERADAVVALAQRRCRSVMLLSDAVSAARAAQGAIIPDLQAPTGMTWPPRMEVLVLDRLGLLRQAYACADAAYVGGSLRPGPGGHNLLEAVAADCPLAAGPHLENVADQAAVLAQAGAHRRVRDVGGLLRFWTDVIEKPQEFRPQLGVARGLVAERCGAVERTVAELLSLLDHPSETPP